MRTLTYSSTHCGYLHCHRSHHQRPTTIRRAHTSSPLKLDHSVIIEEETLPGYNPSHYYAVRIGDLLRDRYHIIGKLGYGSTSTVWLCRDLKSQGSSVYVALKIHTNNNSKSHRELPVYKYINNLKESSHEGRKYVRALRDHFELEGPHGNHICLVHETAGLNLEELRDLLPNQTFEPDLLRQSLRSILRGLHFLHSEVGVIHTDIQPKNILLGVLDNSAFERFERDEKEAPFPQKELPCGRIVYVSHPMPLTKGPPLLCDLSEARFATSEHQSNKDLIMPDLYRAPEVILGMPWSYEVDIWGFGMMLWDLLEPTRLFAAKGPDGRYSEAHHLAQMIAMMGPPPTGFLERSDHSAMYFDQKGHWKGGIEIPEDMTLEAAEQRLQGEEKAQFLNLMRKTLQWRPEDRCSIEDIYLDEWMMADLITSGEIVSTCSSFPSSSPRLRFRPGPVCDAL
ncbi:SRSF protein kinase 2 [Cercospora beticola]|nr:SRSF protein kinase 2 [Cercospora beticola]PIA97368.1 SRSF protein kinase 2 [Cercospora beticola]